MTFRHTKFEDSQVMRSLEKIAVEKGLVKPAPAKSIHKTASNNLVPSGNFTQDIIKLCAGLRSNGFNKYAEEIESKFLMFKQADTLYQTSKETGEDLIDAAHPEGSHKLDGLDHTVLTIVDRQKRIQEILNKQPMGKLATNKEILHAVKKALGQTPADTEASFKEATEITDDQNFRNLPSSFNSQIKKVNDYIYSLEAQIRYKIKKATRVYEEFVDVANNDLGWYTRINGKLPSSDVFFKPIDDSNNYKPSVFLNMKKKMSALYNKLKPEGTFTVGGVSDDVWIDIKGKLKKMNGFMTDSINLFELIQENEVKLTDLNSQKESEVSDPNFTKFQSFKQSIKSLEFNREKYPKLSDELEKLNNLKIAEYDPEVHNLQLSSIADAVKKTKNSESVVTPPTTKTNPTTNPTTSPTSASAQDNVIPADLESVNRAFTEYNADYILVKDKIASSKNQDDKKLITVNTLANNFLTKNYSAESTTISQIKQDFRGTLKSISNTAANSYLKALAGLINSYTLKLAAFQAPGSSLANDGVFSSKALNAIKALKISLGEGEDEARQKAKVEVAHDFIVKCRDNIRKVQWDITSCHDQDITGHQDSNPEGFKAINLLDDAYWTLDNLCKPEPSREPSSLTIKLANEIEESLYNAIILFKQVAYRRSIISSYVSNDQSKGTVKLINDFLPLLNEAKDAINAAGIILNTNQPTFNRYIDDKIRANTAKAANDANDGVFSSKALNAIKALKISLGEGEEVLNVPEAEETQEDIKQNKQIRTTQKAKVKVALNFIIKCRNNVNKALRNIASSNDSDIKVAENNRLATKAIEYLNVAKQSLLLIRDTNSLTIEVAHNIEESLYNAITQFMRASNNQDNNNQSKATVKLINDFLPLLNEAKNAINAAGIILNTSRPTFNHLVESQIKNDLEEAANERAEASKKRSKDYANAAPRESKDMIQGIFAELLKRAESRIEYIAEILNKTNTPIVVTKLKDINNIILSRVERIKEVLKEVEGDSALADLTPGAGGANSDKYTAYIDEYNTINNEQGRYDKSIKYMLNHHRIGGEL